MRVKPSSRLFRRSRERASASAMRIMGFPLR
jgi:hypothetical protein